jgi:hypothetical protein
MFASKDTLLTRPSGGYNIARSVRFRSSASAYFNRTLTTPTNNKIWTWSSWVKRGTLGSAQVLLSSDVGTSNTTWLEFGFDAADTFTITAYSADSNTTSAVFRDPSAWYHIIVAFDSTQATAANRCKIYVNGVQQTLTGSGFTLNAGYGINSAQATAIGFRNWTPSGRYFDGYLTEINFVDGQQLTPSSFGETDSITGVWKPKAYSGTYGTNGFELNFSDNSASTATTIGKDYSGNGNNWTPNNISVTAGATYDSMQDVPTLTSATAANYCVLNPVNLGDNNTTSNANLTGTIATTSGRPIYGSIAVTTGKWYWETLYTASTNDALYIGVNGASLGQNINAYSTSPNIIYGDGLVSRNNSTIVSSLATITVNDIVGVALDVGAGTIAFYKNNTLLTTQNLPTGDGFGWRPLWLNGTSAGNQSYAVTFGQRPFSYTPPTGFVALNTYNLPASTITNGAAYMAATTYTGNGGTLAVSNAVNGVSFQPDWVWIKMRSGAAGNELFDSVRGANIVLFSNATNAESNSGTMSTFGSGGFTAVYQAGDISTNNSGSTFVGWQWKAGTTSASNTNGSITSTVSVGATQGFSVVTYTGTGVTATVGHGLGVAPSMIIVKNRSAVESWRVGHSFMNGGSSPWNYYMNLNATSAQAASSSVWNNTAPTSSVFSISNDSAVSGNTNALVAYCFSAVAGYSAFGSYTGNGSADGPFVYLGFRPRWVMSKRTDSTGSWLVVDSSRNTYNVVNGYLVPNTSDAEGSATWGDFLSNGFKLRGTTHNGSGESYIYACFAENPFKNSLAR